MSRVVLPRAQQPRVSLVMTQHGKADLTIRSLAAVAECTLPVYETFVVDDATPEGAADAVQASVDGVEVLRGRGMGFGEAMNLGVGRSRAALVCLVNNDVIPETGWLEPLLERVAQPGVAAAVPMLLYPDGTLQEAGAAMGCDGFSWRWGHGRPPHDPEVAFPRVVDYGSACVLLRTDVFRAAGGFRPEYGAGYLEDADLFTTIRSMGWDTIYEPRSRVSHIEHATFGAERAARLSQENRPKLLARWGTALADRPPMRFGARHPTFAVRVRDAVASHRVLVVAAEPGWMDLATALQRLLPRARVTVLPCGDAAPNGAGPDLARQGLEVVNPRDPSRWLADRRGHPDLVWIHDSRAMGELGVALHATQRQAAWLYRVTDPRTAPPTNGMSPPPLVVVTGEADIGAASQRFPTARILGDHTQLQTLLAASGVLATDPEPAPRRGPAAADVAAEKE